MIELESKLKFHGRNENYNSLRKRGENTDGEFLSPRRSRFEFDQGH